MYDIIIIGAGVNGCFIARDAARYNLKILVLEKENDVGNLTTAANSAIIHSGYDPHPHTLKAKLNVLGNQMYDTVCQDLDIEFERIGSLTIATNDEEVAALDFLVERANENQVPVEILDADEVIKKEPYITKNVRKALYAKTAAIINPFELCVGLMENAMDNGVELRLNTEVQAIKKENDVFQVITNKGEFQSKIIVNAAGVHADEVNNMINNQKLVIKPRKGEYFVLDHFKEPYVNHVLFTIPSKKGKGVLVTPTTHGNYLIGPSSDFIEDKEDYSTNKEVLDLVIENAKRVVDYIPKNMIVRQYAGLRAYHESDDFVINEQDKFINVLGMQSPGLASAPATSKMVIEMISKLIKLEVNPRFNPVRRPLYRLKEQEIAKRKAIIKANPSFGNIICRCEEVSEGEIVDAIHRNCGARTIKGVKKRVRPGAGKCQGGFCESHIIRILARELKVDMKDILYDGVGSNILLASTKGDKNEKI